MIRLRIRVEGRVQGVFYRASTQSKALELGLTGWVKNEADGSVLMEIQGSKEAIDKMVKWCHDGPIMSRVDNLVQEEIAPESTPGFEIVR